MTRSNENIQLTPLWRNQTRTFNWHLTPLLRNLNIQLTTYWRNQTRTFNWQLTTDTLTTKLNKNIQVTPYDEIKQEHSTDTLITKFNKNIQVTPYDEIKQEHSTDTLMTKSYKNIQVAPLRQNHTVKLHPYDEPYKNIQVTFWTSWSVLMTKQTSSTNANEKSLENSH